MRLSTIILLLLTSFTTVLAQEADNDSLWQALQLNSAVITGTRTPKFLKDTPVQTRLITAKDIERTGATNIQELLTQEIPSAEFSYAMNQKTHLNFAGFGGQGILFLVDGERLAGETMDDVDFSRLTMHDVERIEIVKGAASALYGSNATGGVINLITKQATKPWTLNAMARYGKHNDQHYALNFGVNRRQWSNQLTGGWTSHDSYHVQSAAGAVTRVVSTVYGERSFNAKEQLTWHPTTALSITGRAGYFFRQTIITPELPERYRDFSGGVRMNWDITDKDNLQLNYGFDEYDKSDYQRQRQLDIRDYSNVQNTVRALFTHTFAGDALTVGADYLHDYLFSENLQGKKHAQDCFDLFAQYDWQVNKQWELVGALRYDYLSDAAASQITPKLNVRFKPRYNLTFRAGYGMGFRAPQLKERYYNFNMAGLWIVEGNPDLQSETSHNFNISAEYAKRRWNFTASAYYNLVSNKIATAAPYYRTTTDPLPYLPYTNLKNYNVLGGELGVQAQWPCGINMRMTYAYTHEQLPKDHTGSTINNQYIPARPHALNVRLNYDHDFTPNYGISCSISGRVLSSVSNEEYRDYYAPSRGTVTVSYPAYTIWNLAFTQCISKHLRVTASLDNLLNYRPQYYYLNAPMTDGLTCMVGMTFNIL